jgi:hypothetical protein
LLLFLAGVFIMEEAKGFAGLRIGFTAAAVCVEVLAARLVAEDIFNAHFLYLLSGTRG